LDPKILIVEDDFANQQVSSLFLKKFGFEVDIAVNGAVAVEHASKTKYGLILMDCQMPVMDGFEATKLIRSQEGPNQKTSIVALTANLMNGINQTCRDSGMDDVLNKPIKMQKMQEMATHWYNKESTN
jgi:CheY-like chemotaxis protein